MLLRTLGLASLPLLALSSAAIAQEDVDATFNGLAQKLSCGIKTLILCEGEYCMPLIPANPVAFATWEVWLRTKEFKESPVRPLQRMTNVNSGKSEINKPLTLKFTVLTDGAPMNVMLMGQPKQGGYYQWGVAATFMNKEKKAVVGGSCEVIE